jgi:hypothetical protein
VANCGSDAYSDQGSGGGAGSGDRAFQVAKVSAAFIREAGA